MDTDADLQPLAVERLRTDPVLQGHRRLHGSDDAVEGGEQCVTCHRLGAAVMLADDRLGDRLQMMHRVRRALVVLAHQLAEAGDVGEQHGADAAREGGVGIAHGSNRTFFSSGAKRGAVCRGSEVQRKDFKRVRIFQVGVLVMRPPRSMGPRVSQAGLRPMA